MELKYDNIHEYTIKCSNTTQITLDDDYNVPDSKTDIDSIIKDFGLVVTDGVRVNHDKAQVEGTLNHAVQSQSQQKAASSIFSKNLHL